jgi:hypothetical protein
MKTLHFQQDNVIAEISIHPIAHLLVLRSAPFIL